MTWFSIPEGYQCVVRNNDTTLFAYQGSRRDTYTLNGLSWQKTATSSSTNYPSNTVCISTPQIPSSVHTGLIVGGVLIMLAFFSFIAKMIRRTYL